MTTKELIKKLKDIQSNLQNIFNLLNIPYLQKIDEFKPISNNLIESNRQNLLKCLNKILVGFKEIKSEKLIQITDFKSFLNEMYPIIKKVKSIFEKSQKNRYNWVYLTIQLYWYIEYFIKHEIEFKKNEFFNEDCHYKWIIDDVCLDFLINLYKNPNSSINILNEIDKRRKDAIFGINLLEIIDGRVVLTSLGKVICDLAIIGDIYSYYIDEFNEMFEESVR